MEVSCWEAVASCGAAAWMEGGEATPRWVWAAEVGGIDEAAEQTHGAGPQQGYRDGGSGRGWVGGSWRAPPPSGDKGKARTQAQLWAHDRPWGLSLSLVSLTRKLDENLLCQPQRQVRLHLKLYLGRLDRELHAKGLEEESNRGLASRGAGSRSQGEIVEAEVGEDDPVKVWGVCVCVCMVVESMPLMAASRFVLMVARFWPTELYSLHEDEQLEDELVHSF